MKATSIDIQQGEKMRHKAKYQNLLKDHKNSLNPKSHQENERKCHKDSSKSPPSEVGFVAVPAQNNKNILNFHSPIQVPHSPYEVSNKSFGRNNFVNTDPLFRPKDKITEFPNKALPYYQEKYASSKGNSAKSHSNCTPANNEKDQSFIANFDEDTSSIKSDDAI